MPSNPLLTLSSKGILTGVGERCDRLWAYFLASQASQTFLYNGQVKSLQSLIALADGDAGRLQSSIEAALTALFNAQFDSATCSVTVTTPAWDGSSRFNIAIDLLIVENGQSYSVGRELQTINGVVQPLIDANNG